MVATTADDKVEEYFPIDGGDWHLFVRWHPASDELTAALTVRSRHVRRYDSVEHRGIEPHVHFFDGTREMHNDVREFDTGDVDQADLAAVLRRFADSVNLWISEAVFTVDETTRFEFPG